MENCDTKIKEWKLSEISKVLTNYQNYCSIDYSVISPVLSEHCSNFKDQNIKNEEVRKIIQSENFRNNIMRDIAFSNSKNEIGM